MGLLDSLGDIPNPTMQKRRAYDPANYSSIGGSGLYAALNQGNAAQNQAMAQSGANQARQYGTMAPDEGAMREMAMRSQMGALQPMDEAQKMAQFHTENTQQDLRDNEAWQLQGLQQAMRDQQSQQLGNVVGNGLGFGATAYGNNKTNNQYRQQSAKNQRANVPSGPINNSYSQGW